MDPILSFLALQLSRLRACWFWPADCFEFWYWVMIGAFVIGVSIFLWVAWRLYDYKMKWAAAMRAEFNRQAVDHEAIEALRWRGDDGEEQNLCTGGWDLRDPDNVRWHCADCEARTKEECIHRLTIEKRPEPNTTGDRELGK